MEFILAEGISNDQNFKTLNALGKVHFAVNIADCLNAERSGATAIIWNSEDFDQLEELSPKKSVYGWMLVATNIPIYVWLRSSNQLDKLTNCNIEGFYAEDPEILIEVRNQLKPFFVDK